MTEGRPAPGDSRPRTLARPPGERYGPARGPSGALSTTSVAAGPPSRVRATAFGALAALGVAALFAIIVGILDAGVGLFALAAVGGWAIGFATRRGAWSHSGAIGPGSVRPIAVSLALAAWLAGYVGAYLLSLLLRPDSSLTFGERLSQTSFLDWLAPQFGILQVLEIVLIVVFAAFGARPARTDAVDPATNEA